MDAPTNIVGPDGTLLQRGLPIPKEWFEQLPDLKAHLETLPAMPSELPLGSKAAQAKIAARNAAVVAKAAEEAAAAAPVSTDAAEAEPETPAPAKRVKARATVGRSRKAAQ